MTASGSSLARRSRRSLGWVRLMSEKTSCQKRLDLFLLEAGFVVHAELDGVDFGEDFEEAAEGGFVVGGEVVRGDAPDEAGYAFARILRRAGNAAALHAAAIDVVPYAGGHLDAALVRQADQALKRRGVARLFGLGDADQFDAGELLHVEEIGIERRHEAAVFVAEDDDEAVDAVGGQRVEVAGPVGFVVQAALEVGALHGVHGDAAFGEVGLLGGVADILRRGRRNSRRRGRRCRARRT